MKRDLMDILACPVCKGELNLTADEENDNEIVKGKLTCKQCGEVYPITDTIPDLRPPSLRDGSAADDFEDLDDFDDEEDRPILPIVFGVVIAVVLILVGLRLRSRGKNKQQQAIEGAKSFAAFSSKEASKAAKSGRKAAAAHMPDFDDIQKRAKDSLSDLQDAVTSIDYADLPKDAQKQLLRLANTIDLKDWQKQVRKNAKKARKAVFS